MEPSQGGLESALDLVVAADPTTRPAPADRYARSIERVYGLSTQNRKKSGRVPVSLGSERQRVRGGCDWRGGGGE